MKVARLYMQRMRQLRKKYPILNIHGRFGRQQQQWKRRSCCSGTVKSRSSFVGSRLTSSQLKRWNVKVDIALFGSTKGKPCTRGPSKRRMRRKGNLIE